MNLHASSCERSVCGNIINWQHQNLPAVRTLLQARWIVYSNSRKCHCEGALLPMFESRCEPCRKFKDVADSIKMQDLIVWAVQYIHLIS